MGFTHYYRESLLVCPESSRRKTTVELWENLPNWGRPYAEIRKRAKRGRRTHRSADHLHNFQVCIFRHTPVPEQLHTLDNDRVSGFASVVSFTVYGTIRGSNARRFTPTANVCLDALEQVQGDGDSTDRGAYDHSQHTLQEQTLRCLPVIEGHTSVVDANTGRRKFYS